MADVLYGADMDALRAENAQLRAKLAEWQRTHRWNIEEDGGDLIIRDVFKPGVKLTVLVRTPGNPTYDFMMTDDDLAEVSAMVERRRAILDQHLPAHPTAQGGD